MQQISQEEAADPAAAEAVVRFWLEELTPADWYKGGEALDQLCRDRFAGQWAALRDGALEHWQSGSQSALAYILLADQLPRNMFRDTADAFATDGQARAASKAALTAGWDMRITPELHRQFVYMPLMHSECIEDQERCVRLFMMRMPETGADNLVHARAHREVIRQFGRFPTRNEALGRVSSEGEREYLENGGYAAIVAALRAA